MTRGPPLLCQQGLSDRSRRRGRRPRRARRERRGRVGARCAVCGTRRSRGRRAGVGAPEGGSALLRTGSYEPSGWRRAEDLLKIATLGEGGRRWEGNGEDGRGRVGSEAGPAVGARAQALETHRPGRRRPGWGTRGAGTPGYAAEAREGGTGGRRTQRAPLGGADESSGLDQRFSREPGPGTQDLGFLKRNTPTRGAR